MPSDFGLKIGIEGEKEFKKALSEINQSFKVLGSEMNLVTSQFDKQDKSVGALTARNQVLRKEIDAQKDKVETLEAALKNAASSFGRTISALRHGRFSSITPKQLSTVCSVSLARTKPRWRARRAG